MSEQQLRDALATLTAPTSPPGSADDVLRNVRRRRTGRAVTVGIGALAAAALVAAAVVWSPWREETPAPADPDTSGEAWDHIAESPLSPRTDTVSVWTGTEMIVAGGASATCPDGGDCPSLVEDQIHADGAAYDPATDSWRQIADAPMALVGAPAVWTGTEMVVLAQEYHVNAGGSVRFLTEGSEYRMLGYDPVTDTWREIVRWVGTPFDSLVLVDHDTVAAYQSVDDLGQRIHVFDLETGIPERLPIDPFGSGYDRSLVWTGDEFVLAELSAAEEGGTFQLATIPLDGEAWVELDASPVSFWSQQWFWFDEHLVNPTQEASVVSDGAETTHGALDLATGAWSPVPQLDVDAGTLFGACQMPAVGAAGDWLSGGFGSLVSLDPATATLVPACGGQTPAAAVWTGTEFVIWGGEGHDATDVTGDGWTWTPPPPADVD